MQKNICDFRDLILNLVNSKVEGFDKWQEIFSKVIEKFIDILNDNLFFQHLSYDLASDPEVSTIFEEVN